MIQVLILIDPVHLLYHQIAFVIHQFVIYKPPPFDLTVAVLLHFDLIDLLTLELFHVRYSVLFVNHGP